MESKQEFAEVSPRWMYPQWRQNIRAMQVRLKSRFRIAMTSRRLRARSSGFPSVPGNTKLRATATGFVVARVFQDNVILARMARNLAIQEWQKRVRWVSTLRPTAIFPTAVSSRIWSLLGYSAAGGTLLANESQQQSSSQAEALVLSSTSGLAHRSGPQDFVGAMKGAKNTKAAHLEELAIANASEESLWTQIAQTVMLPAVGGACHVWMHGLNITEVYGAEKLHKAINNRPEGQSLITVCNHVASMDDPLVMAALLPPRLFLQPKSLRWTLCATDRCFTNAAFSAFFRSVKVLPLKRGAGLQQEGIDIALSKLNRGDWVHIFPEGSRSRDGGKTIGTVRRGIGRLVTDVERTPLVVPFVHLGMQDLMPIGSKFPAIKKKVSVLIGDPIDLDDLVKENSMKFGSKGELYDAIAFRVGQRLTAMKVELDHLVAVRETQLAAEEAEKLNSSERAQELLQYVDWESQGVVLQSDPIVRDYILDACSTRNSTSDSQISGARKLSSTEEQTNMRVELNNPEQKISEAEMEEFFELEDDWDPLSKPSILSRVRGFVDTPSFLGLGFAARGLLSDTTERTGSGLDGWKYWGRFSTKPSTRVDRAERFSDFCH